MKIALDIDGCCLNWFKRACTILEFPLIANCWNVPQIQSNWDQILENPRFWTNLESMGEVKFEFDLYLTATPKRWREERIENLKQCGFPERPVVLSDDKITYCLENNIDVLIDDRTETIREGIAKGVEMIQIYPSYARYGIATPYNTSSLYGVPNILKTLEIWQKQT